MVLCFIDRVKELSSLYKWYDTNKFEMIVVYGRRRVGKTYLLKKFLEKKKGFYFLCDRTGTENNIIRLKREFASHIGEQPIESNNIDDIFKYISSRSKEEKQVIIIDEYSYLMEKDDAITSVFQRIVDETFSGSNIMLILCGSSIGMMEDGVMGYGSPLYGRRSGQIKLKPIPFSNSWEFFPETDIERLVTINACFGAIPFYLSLYNEKISLEQNLTELVFDHDGRLYEEMDILLSQELREPDIYKRILSSIAHGSTRPVLISNDVNIPNSDLSKYLNRLLSLGMIKKESSIIDIKGTRPHYSIDDNFINFWFTFGEPYKSNLEIGDLEAPLSNFRKNFNMYVGRRFEELVGRELIWKVLPFHPNTTGRFWNKEIEIDIVSLDEKKEKGLFIEVKWSKIDPERELRSLEKKVEQFPWDLKNKEMMIVAKDLKHEHPNCIDLIDLMKRWGSISDRRP